MTKISRFALNDDTKSRFALLSYCSLRRRVPLRGTSILRLRRAPFDFIGRRPSGQARRLFGWSQTRESLCRTPVSKGLLISYAIPYFHFSVCSLPRIRARQRSLDFASVDDMEQRFAQLAYWSLRRRGCLFEAHLSCAFGAPLLQGATRMACNTVLSFLFLRIYSHTIEVRSLRLRFR